METAIALTLFLIFFSISAIHMYWAFGGRWAGDAVIPTKSDVADKVFNPGMAPTLIVALGLLGFGLLVLGLSGVITMTLPVWLMHSGLWILFGIFAVRTIGDFRYVGFFKRISHTKFARNDTRFFSPLCLVIALLCLSLEMMR